MKIFTYLLITFFLGSCAVQGPITGGPEDIVPPKLDNVFPKNNSIINNNQKITIKFDKPLEPNSVRKAIKINSNDFKLTTRKNKIIVEPNSNWDESQILSIYISKDLMDYRKNNINNPVEFLFSFGQKIPTNLVEGKVVDIDNYFDKYKNTTYEIALYDISRDEKEIIKKVETGDSLYFKFSAVENGLYSIVAVENKIIDLYDDVRKRKYSILSDSLLVTDEIDFYSVVLNVGGPVSKEEISSINFINQYYVDYILTDGKYERGVIDTIYNNYLTEDFGDKELTTSIEVKNEFEKYNTGPFTFSVPMIVDSIAPAIEECSIFESDIHIKFSEPIASFDPADNFYYNDSDSNKIPFNILNFNPKNATMTISSEREDLDSLKIQIQENIIKDLSENFMDETALWSFDCNKINMETSDYGLGGISGKVNTSNYLELVVVAQNISTRESQMSIIDSNNNFYLNKLEPGEYFLQVYENYTVQDDILYPFFPGTLEPFVPSSKFSQIVGPIEVRSNWDIDDIVIKF